MNKLRSFLTTIGIIIGVGTLIAMISIIEGVNKYAYKIMGRIGTNVLYVQKWKWNVGLSRMSRKEIRELAKRRDFSIEDAEAISKLGFVDAVAPYQTLFNPPSLRFRDTKHQPANFIGCTEGYFFIQGYDTEKGRILLKDDNLYRRQVVVIGKYIAEKLFENKNPLGKIIRIGKYNFEIVGVLKERGSFMGSNLDDIVLIPLNTLKKLFRIRQRGPFGIFSSLSIQVKIKEGTDIEKAKEKLTELLRARRGLKFTQENDFSINTQQMLLEAYKNLTRGIFFAMLGIASLALLVGGIGIMNIMLVSVTERTREIGIRMAVGAKRKEIMLQFLFESMLLTLAGGIVGVTLGVGIGKLIDVLTPLPFSAPAWSILLGVGFSSIVGIFFGIYPASKAARLDPIEALRYE